MQKITKIITISISTAIIFVFYLSLNKDNNYNTESQIGKKLNFDKIESIDEDKYLYIKELKGKNFVLINFWASWCGPCRSEHPMLMKLKSEKKLKLIGINFKDKKSNAKIFLKELGNPYYFIGKDEVGKLSINFGVYGIPESILVDEQLTILQKFIGPLDNQDLDDILKKINKV